MTDEWNDKNPGSDAAIAAGCTCAVMDNHHGLGFGDPPHWWISGGCPLHDADARPEPAQREGEE